MHSEEYERMFSLEDHYWWFVARRRLALGLLRAALGIPPSLGAVGEGGKSGPPAILDLGCGTGVVLREMGEWAEPMGVDMSTLALAFCRRRNLTRLVAARGESLPLQDETFDGVVALDIFEHIHDDAAALQEAHRILRPGGVLVLSVPAFRMLWGPHDVALMHQRRYRARQVRARLTNAGFEVQRLSYSIFLLFPVVLVIRAFEKLKRGKPEASLPAVPRWFNRALVALQDLEAAMIRRCSLPWGSSVVAVARKAAGDRTSG